MTMKPQEDGGRAASPNRLSQAEPQEGLGPSGFDPARDAFSIELELRQFHARAGAAIDAAAALGWLRQYGAGSLAGSSYASDWRGAAEAKVYLDKATKRLRAMILESAIRLAEADVGAAYRDSDGSGEADETAQQAQPEATARAEGIARKDHP